MFDQLQDPKLQELMDKIQELMQKLEKDQSLHDGRDENGKQELEKELDRMMELFKTLEVEHPNAAGHRTKLKEMAKEEEQISDKTKDLDPKEKTDQQNKDQQNKKRQSRSGQSPTRKRKTRQIRIKLTIRIKTNRSAKKPTIKTKIRQTKTKSTNKKKPCHQRRTRKATGRAQ
ncbi:MAG: hypothetical protein IPO69_16060 [Saprospiraceae bacterium]|nr:hypothetical protein [Saprospiraceae bacterium]